MKRHPAYTMVSPWEGPAVNTSADRDGAQPVCDEVLPDQAGAGRFARGWAGRLSGEFWVLATAALLYNVGMSTYLFLYNLFMLDIGFRVSELGLFAGATALGSLIGTVPMMLLARRIGHRRLLLLCLLLDGVTLAVRVLVSHLDGQIAFALLDGVLLAGWVVCITPAVASVVDADHRPSAYSVLFAVAVGGCSLGGLLGGEMPDHLRGLAVVRTALNGQRATLLLASGLTALAAYPVWRLRPGRAAPVRHWFTRPTPYLSRFLVGNALWGAALGAFNPFTNVFFSRHLGAATSHLGSFFALAQLVQAGAVLLMPLILRRMGLVPAITLMQVVTAATLAMLASCQGLLSAELIYCVFMAAQHMADPALQSVMIGSVNEQDRSAATAMAYLTLSVAQAVAAPLAGYAFTNLPVPQVVVGIAVAVAASAMIFRMLLHRCSVARVWAIAEAPLAQTEPL